MSLLSSCIESSPNIPYFSPSLPSGVEYSITWTAAASSTLSGVIYSSSVTSTSALSVSLQPKLISAQTLTDAAACWLIAAIPIPGVGLRVYIYAGGGGVNSAPVDNTNYGVSWAVASI